MSLRSLQKKFEARQKAYQALLDSDWDKFAEARFSEFNEGFAFLVANLDLRDVDFDGFKGDFVYFYHCDLRGVDFTNHGAWPLMFEECDMRDMNLRGQQLRITTLACDMRGIKYDEKTELNSENFEPSEINHSLLDDEFIDFLNNQSVVFDKRNLSPLEVI